MNQLELEIPWRSPLFIVGCTATKAPVLRTRPLTARLAYCGPIFLDACRRLDEAGAEWCILSAHYGFIPPEHMIEHYDVRMPAQLTEADVCWGWPFDFMDPQHFSGRRLIVLAGKDYAAAARYVLPYSMIEAPLAGLAIGYARNRLRIELGRELATPVSA